MRAKGVVRPAVAGLVLAAVLSVLAGLVPPAAGPAFLASPLGAVAPAVALAADDLGVTTKARYVVEPDAGVVHVTVDVTALNQKPNRSTSGVITRYFYNQVNLGVQLEATHVKASRGGTALPVTSARRKTFRLVTVGLGSDLYFGRDDARPHPVRPAGRASRARGATSGSGRPSRRSSRGPSATRGASGSTCRRRSPSTSRART